MFSNIVEWFPAIYSAGLRNVPVRNVSHRRKLLQRGLVNCSYSSYVTIIILDVMLARGCSVCKYDLTGFNETTIR